MKHALVKQSLPQRVAALSALDDPTRLALRDFIAHADGPVSRDQAATALDLPRSTAAFHLDKLVDAGLLEATFRRLSGRTGPGAGRPAKLYQTCTAEVTVSVPARQYDLAARLMAEAIEQSGRTGEAVQAALPRVAAEAGRSIGASAGTLQRALEENGFEPRNTPDGSTILGNCPFHRLAQQHTELVCSLNMELLRGVAEGCGDCQHTLVADPGQGRCCVRIDPVERD